MLGREKLCAQCSAPFRPRSGGRASVTNVSGRVLPLRLFIGIGWIRASSEKITDTEWHDGTALSTFLEEHLAGGEIVFPLYQDLVTDVFLPNASVLGWIIIVGQFLVGVAVLTGTFSNIGLLGGLFMNLNFLLAGAVNPSAFYMVIQSVLFISNTAAVLGVDWLLSGKIPFALLVAQPEFERKYLWIEKLSFLSLRHYFEWNSSICQLPCGGFQPNQRG